MVRKWSGVAGALIFLLAIGVGAYLLAVNQRAQGRDHTDTGHGVIVSDFPPCVWDVGLPQRVLSENNSQTLIVNATNTHDVDCQSELSILAPGFEVSPLKDTQMITAKPKSQGSIAWIVVPKTAGSFDLAVSDGIDTHVVGVTVTNVLGLTAVQSQLLSTLGTLFGPMLTIPWWIERWQQRKRARPQPPIPTPPSP